MGITALEVYFRPPMAIARLGGSDTPLESFIWSEDPTIPGAAKTVIEPAVTLEIEPDGSIRPYIPGTIRFRDKDHFRPVAPFFELWLRYESDNGVFHDEPLTRDVLREAGATTEAISYVVTAVNRKAARRSGETANGFQARIQVAGNNYRRHPLLASSLRQPGKEPLVLEDRPIPLGTFQVIRPTGGREMGVDLGALRVRFTPAKGEVYGPPSAQSAPAPDTGLVHMIVKPENRILNQKASWLHYNADYTKFDNPEPSDTFDGADVDPNNFLNNVAWGVVDDTCDVLIVATLVIAGVRLLASARAFVGPPDFAPDRRPFVSLVDDLADRDLGAPAPVTSTNVEMAELEIADLFQRVSETVSLADLDALRRNAIADNAANGFDTFTQPPRTDNQTMTAADAPYADLTPQLVQPPTPQAPLPYTDAAQVAHLRLAELDDLLEFLRFNGDRVRQMLRPPYGYFRELSENPASDAKPDPGHRDPRINRDRAHDMRMPPYMRDADASALSVTHRQYLQLMALLDFLGEPPAAPSARVLPQGSRAALPGRELPIRQRVRDFIATQANLSGTDPAPDKGAPRP
jgi:hypothetical protein